MGDQWKSMTYNEAIKKGWKPLYSIDFKWHISQRIKAGKQHIKRGDNVKYFIDLPYGRKIYLLPPWVSLDKHNFEEYKRIVDDTNA